MAKASVLLIIVFLLIGLMLAEAGDFENVLGAEIWFGPLSHASDMNKYMELFNDPDAWENSRDIMDVFIVPSDDEAIFNKMIEEDAYEKINNMGLDIALYGRLGKVIGSQKSLVCSGESNIDFVNDQIDRIKNSGADVKYVMLLEPLYKFSKRENYLYADYDFNFGMAGDVAITGDWDGDGKDTIGVYRPSAKKFILSNSNDDPKKDISFVFNEAGDVAITGDWDGDGKDTIGIYNKQYSTFKLRNSNTDGNADLIVTFGMAGDVAITGDWDGDGKDTIGLHRGCNFILSNSNNNPIVDKNLCYGTAGDVAITGDWDGDGNDEVGIYRISKNSFYVTYSIDNASEAIVANSISSVAGDVAITGDWDGDGKDNAGIFRTNQRFMLMNNALSRTMCEMTPEQAADQTKKFVDGIKMENLDIIIGYVEPLPVLSIDEINSYISRLESNGIHLPFFFADMAISNSNVNTLKELKDMVGNHDIDFGLIMMPNLGVTQDSLYYNQIIEKTELVMDEIGIPDRITYESWGDWQVALPSILIPDNQQYTFTKTILDSWNIMASDICGNGRCESGETETNCQEDCSISNTNCMGNGKDQDGLCNIDCDADESCDGKSPLSTLESCGEFGNDAVLDRCSSSCEVEDKPDNICRKSGIADCTGDDECNGKEIETYNCDEYCNYIEPVCGDSICDFGENSGNCADDCSDIKEESCGDDNCSDDENCGDCPEDCGYCGADLDSDYDAINEGDGLNDNATYDGLTYKNNSEDSEANAGINKIKGNIFFNKIKCILKSIFLFKDYGECMASAV